MLAESCCIETGGRRDGFHRAVVWGLAGQWGRLSRVALGSGDRVGHSGDCTPPPDCSLAVVRQVATSLIFPFRPLSMAQGSGTGPRGRLLGEVAKAIPSPDWPVASKWAWQSPLADRRLITLARMLRAKARRNRPPDHRYCPSPGNTIWYGLVEERSRLTRARPTTGGMHGRARNS